MTNGKLNKIILGHTYREADGYLASLSFRLNSKYNKKPHYLIKKSGEVINLLALEEKTNIFKSNDILDGFISIMIENLGYLLNDGDEYYNWKGEYVSTEPFKRSWRGYEYWDGYTIEQIESLAKLCNEICAKNQIPKIFIGHNTKINDASKFYGIITRSNFSSRHTDLNPSFDFVHFKNILENG